MFTMVAYFTKESSNSGMFYVDAFDRNSCITFNNKDCLRNIHT